jgi:BREX protein BrxB
MNTPISRKERLEHMLKVVTSERFLKKQGLGNEVPFFICDYTPTDGLVINEDREDIVTRASHVGVKILDLNLFDLCLDLLKERDILDQVLEMECDWDKAELKELLQNVLDPAEHLVPKIAAEIHSTQHDVIFLSGVGEIYPFIRSHNVLNNLQSTAKQAPTVMFFPGTYTHALATGASLDLFGLLHDDKYYRAFNLMKYEV